LEIFIQGGIRIQELPHPTGGDPSEDLVRVYARSKILVIGPKLSHKIFIHSLLLQKHFFLTQC